MVARGGGGRGGGSRGGGGSSSKKNSTSSSRCSYANTTCYRTSNYTAPPSPFKAHYKLGGDHFHNSMTTATLAIQCFCVVAIIAIAIWSFRIKKGGDPSRDVFKFFGLGVSLISTLISLGFQITDKFLHEFEISVNGYYFIMSIVIAFFSFQATFFLVKLAYSIVTRRYQHARSKSSKSSPGIQWLHRMMLVALGILWIVAMYFFIRYQIFVIYASSKLGGYAKSFGQTASAFKILVVLAVIEGLALGVVVWLRQRKQAKSSKIATYTLFALFVPLLLRSIVDLAITLSYQLRSKPIATPNSVALVSALLVDVPAVVVLAAVVLIGVQKDWSVQYSPVMAKYNSPAFEPMKAGNVQVHQTQHSQEYVGHYSPTPPPQNQFQHGQVVYQPQYGNPQAQPFIPQQQHH